MSTLDMLSDNGGKPACFLDVGGGATTEKVDASIFEDRRRKYHTYNSSSNIVHNCAPKSLEWTKLHTLIRTCIKINNYYLIYGNSNTRVTHTCIVMY